MAALIAAAATLAGLAISFAADLPTNQTLCATACALLALILPLALRRRSAT